MLLLPWSRSTPEPTCPDIEVVRPCSMALPPPSMDGKETGREEIGREGDKGGDWEGGRRAGWEEAALHRAPASLARVSLPTAAAQSDGDGKSEF